MRGVHCAINVDPQTARVYARFMRPATHFDLDFLIIIRFNVNSFEKLSSADWTGCGRMRGGDSSDGRTGGRDGECGPVVSDR